MVLHSLVSTDISTTRKKYLVQVSRVDEKLNVDYHHNEKLISKEPSFIREYSVQLLKEEGMDFPVYARSGTSDIAVYRETFIKRDYLFDLPFTPKLIIDGGANVGYSSILFATTYTEAEIIAVEPDPSNFEVLEVNTAPYGKIHPVRSGLWDKDTFLTVHDVGLDKWGTVVQESDESVTEAFKATTISSLLDAYPNQDIDILKLDIEGAERELFTSNYEEWLGKVKVLIIELHDLIKPGCSMAFFKAVSNYPFITFTRGENLVLMQESLFFPNR